MGGTGLCLFSMEHILQFTHQTFSQIDKCHEPQYRISPIWHNSYYVRFRAKFLLGHKATEVSWQNMYAT